MEIFAHDLAHLFAQLGLDNSDRAIAEFIAAHQQSEDVSAIDELPFWTDSQRAFLVEGLADDSVWAASIDELNTLLQEVQ